MVERDVNTDEHTQNVDLYSSLGFLPVRDSLRALNASVFLKTRRSRQAYDHVRKTGRSIHTTICNLIHIEYIESYLKPGCREFMLTFVPKGGLWSSTNPLERIRLFSNKVLSDLDLTLEPLWHRLASGLGYPPPLAGGMPPDGAMYGCGVIGEGISRWTIRSLAK